MDWVLGRLGVGPAALFSGFKIKMKIETNATGVPLNMNPPPVPGSKVKRTRKPWVYKSELDRLQKKYNIVKYLALAGWFLLAIAVRTLTKL